eukprot:95286-Amphidinium_carterae.2
MQHATSRVALDHRIIGKRAVLDLSCHDAGVVFCWGVCSACTKAHCWTSAEVVRRQGSNASSGESHLEDLCQPSPLRMVFLPTAH